MKIKPYSFLMILGLFFWSACTMEATPLGTPVPTRAATISSLSIANPAAAFCQQKGYRDELITNSDGSQSGVCVFSDGSQCDDWAFLRGVCGPGTKTPGVVVQTPAPALATLSTSENQAVEAARLSLTNRLNIALDDVKLSTLERVTWSDTCLGLADPTEVCTQVETPGFKITLTVGITNFVFHTDLEGANIRLESNTPATH